MDGDGDGDGDGVPYAVAAIAGIPEGALGVAADSLEAGIGIEST